MERVTHSIEEDEAARRATEGFFNELKAMEGLWVHSAESLALEREGQMLSEARAKALLAKLTAAFEKAGDTVNLLWLKATLAGEDDLKKMAEASGRRVTEFYDAADRRKRAIRRLLAEEHSEPYREE